MIDQGFIKGYILHSKGMLVLQKGPHMGFLRYGPYSKQDKMVHLVNEKVANAFQERKSVMVQVQ